MADSEIRRRLEAEDLVFLTQDAEFADIPLDYRATIIISQVRQSRPIPERIQIWFDAVQSYLAKRPTGKLFDLLDTGELIPWEVHEIGD